MAVTIVQTASGSRFGSGNWQAGLSSAATAGNIVITLCASTDNFTAPWVVPTGFTKLFDADAKDARICGSIAAKVATGDETDIQWISNNNVNSQTVQYYTVEVSGLASITPHVTIDSGGAPVTSQSTGTTAATTVDTWCLAFGGYDASGGAGASAGWSNSFSEVFAGNNVLSVATRDAITSGTALETTYDADTVTGEEMYAALAAFEIAASTEVSDINTDEIVEDGESGVTFTTSGFGSEISTATINDGTNSTSASNISSTSGAGTFDLPDVSGYASDTAGSPFTTASHTIQATLGDGTDTANLSVTYNPKAGWAVVEVASAVKTQGSVFENFVGTITDASQVLYPTSNNTSVSAAGIITTDASQDIDMQFWDVTDGTWKPFTALIGGGNGASQVQPVVSSFVLSMVSNTVK